MVHMLLSISVRSDSREVADLPASERNSPPFLSLTRQTCGGDVRIQIMFQLVVAGQINDLSALLPQAQPGELAARLIVAHLQCERGRDARKGVGHRRDQGAVAQGLDGGDINRVENRALPLPGAPSARAAPLALAP